MLLWRPRLELPQLWYGSAILEIRGDSGEATMKKSKAIALAGLAALTLASCNKAPDEAAVDPVIEPATPDTAAVEGEPVAGDPEAGEGEDALQTQPFTSTDGIIITQADVVEPVLPGTIPSTDAGARLKAIPQGRQDPFSGRVVIVRPLPPDPEVLESTDFAVPSGASVPASTFIAGNNSGAVRGGGGGAANRGGNASAPVATATSRGNASSGGSSGGATVARGKASSGSGSSGVGSSGSGSSGSGSSGSVATTSGSGSSGSVATTSGGSAGGDSSAAPQIAAGPSTLPDLTPREPIPDPTLARAVEVTGVIQVGSSYQAIVKAPDEPTSRYVSVGQRLSNGRVLVKRIESNGSEPVVILEESGVEVVRAIGASSDGAQETAALPTPATQI